MITLANCKLKLEVMGIYLDQTGAVDLLSQKLSERLVFNGWEYMNYEDMLRIYTDTPEVDMSDFGELVLNDTVIG